MESAEWGVGVHANITTATIKAMISGLNRIHRDLRNKEGQNGAIGTLNPG